MGTDLAGSQSDGRRRERPARGVAIKEQVMADRNDKVESNAPGRYFVDASCIDCDVCREIAPDNIRANEDEGYSYVFKQPENDAEEELMQQAMDECPVEAIGDDGDQ
jgi:ferredoxin